MSEVSKDYKDNGIGKRIAQLRKQKNLSQEYLAAKLDVSRQAVSKWEQDLTNPDTGNLIRLAELFNVSVEYLSMGDDPANQWAGSGAEARRELKRSPYLPVSVAICGAAHLVLAIWGKVNIVAVFALPIMCVFITLIMYAAFSSMVASSNHDMLAGYNKKKDNLKAIQLQMHWIELLCNIISLLFEIAFILVYFTPSSEQMNTTVILLLVYISSIAICVTAVNMKIKSR